MSTNQRLVLFVVLLVGVTGILTAGRPVYLGNKNAARKPVSQIDHSAWNRLLGQYVDENGMVNYRDWQASSKHRDLLRQYLEHLSQADLGDAAAEPTVHHLAYWINAYNAVTIEGILREYPTSSIRNHTAKLWGYNIWKDLQLYVGGQPISLDAIEHQVLRKMNEPKIHFAIVCASVSCPRLLNEAYVAEKLETQLNDNAKDFFSRKRNFRFDADANRMELSSILSWFASDFGSTRADQLKRIAPWLPTSAARSAADSGDVAVSYLSYNWNLNEQK